MIRKILFFSFIFNIFIFIENIYTNVDFQYKTDYNYGIMNIYDFSMNLVDSFECAQFNNYNNLEATKSQRIQPTFMQVSMDSRRNLQSFTVE